jgi:hypothetical protein
LFQRGRAAAAVATPVRIVGEKGLLTVRLELEEARQDGAVTTARADAREP